MNHKHIKLHLISWFVILIIFGIPLLITCIISMSWLYSHAEIQEWYQRKAYIFLQLKEESEASFTFVRYRLSRIFSIVLWLIMILTLTLFATKYRNHALHLLKHISKGLYASFSKVFCTFRTLPKTEKWALSLLWLTIIGYQVRHYFYFPFFGDDLASYVYFARNGPLFTAVFYPIPNNHVFYNLLSSVIVNFVNDPFLSTRLISFASFHLLILVLFVYLYRAYSNKWAAYFAVAFCGFFFASSIYSVMGRGYMLFSLMAILASISLLRYIETRSMTMFSVMITSSILGAYTVPTFLIPFIGIMATFLILSYQQKDKSLQKDIVICVFSVGLGVLVLYLPMFLFSGIEAIVGNKYVSSDERANFYTYAYPIAVAEVLSLMAGTNTRGWLVFLILGGLSFPLRSKYHYRARNWLVLSLCIFAAIFLYTLVSRSFMPLRVLTYASFFLYTSYAIIITYWIERIKLGRLLYPIILVLIPTVGWWQYQHTVYLSYLFPKKIHEVTRKFVDRVIYDGESAFISTELKYFHWYYIYRNEIAENNIALKNDSLSADLIFLTSEAEHLVQKGYELVETVKGIEYSPDYYIYERNP